MYTITCSKCKKTKSTVPNKDKAEEWICWKCIEEKEQSDFLSERKDKTVEERLDILEKEFFELKKKANRTRRM